MDNPIVAGDQAADVEVEAGKGVYWCACGKSKKQPFCDGSHKGTTSIMPLYFIPQFTETISLCMCKHTTTPPYCDNIHCTRHQE